MDYNNESIDNIEFTLIKYEYSLFRILFKHIQEFKNWINQTHLYTWNHEAGSYDK